MPIILDQPVKVSDYPEKSADYFAVRRRPVYDAVDLDGEVGIYWVMGLVSRDSAGKPIQNPDGSYEFTEILSGRQVENFATEMKEAHDNWPSGESIYSHTQKIFYERLQSIKLFPAGTVV